MKVVPVRDRAMKGEPVRVRAMKGEPIRELGRVRAMKVDRSARAARGRQCAPARPRVPVRGRR
jgi:hypothetical protein